MKKIFPYTLFRALHTFSCKLKDFIISRFEELASLLSTNMFIMLEIHLATEHLIFYKFYKSLIGIER